jgi:hypothetical protein
MCDRKPQPSAAAHFLSVLVFCLSISTIAPKAMAQEGPSLGRQLPNPTPRPPDLQKLYDQDPAIREKIQRAIAIKNELRQEKLVSGTDKLLLLAHDLKVQVAKGSGNSISTESDTAEEIERLAKMVKDRMRSE